MMELRHEHRHVTICPGCGKDCSRVGINNLVYTYETCTCDQSGLPDNIPHTALTIWHKECYAASIKSAAEKVAPDLLKACKAAVAELRQLYKAFPSMTTDRVAGIAEAAIARAEGDAHA